MTDETNGAVPTDAEDTAAVLSIAAGEKTYLAAEGEAQPATAEPEEEDPGEDPAAAEADTAPDKRKMTAKERVQQAVARQREAERDRDFYKEQALRGTAPAEKSPAQEAQPTQGDGRPDPASYEGGVYDPRYIEDLTDYKAETAVTRRLSEREAVQTIQTRLSTFESKAKELFPEGEPDGLKAFRALPSVPQGMADVLLASDIGPKVADHLGANQRELQRISGLSPALQARELTLLEARLADPPKPIPKTATDAPEPAPQARGAGGQFTVAADTNDFAAFEKQYRIGG